MLCVQTGLALKAAIELDLFTAVGEGAQTASELAERCKASERGTRILCDYLVVIGFLTKDGGRYGLTPDAYRAKWNLPADYPMTAPNYAARRSDFAKQIGLGKPSRKKRV